MAAGIELGTLYKGKNNYWISTGQNSEGGIQVLPIQFPTGTPQPDNATLGFGGGSLEPNTTIIREGFLTPQQMLVGLEKGIGTSLSTENAQIILDDARNRWGLKAI